MAGDGYRVGVVGATGLVGSTILRLLSERDFPISELVPFASERSAKSTGNILNVDAGNAGAFTR